MSCRTWVSTESRTWSRVEPMRDTRTTPSRTHTSWLANGHTIPAANRNAPTGGPTSWLAVRRAGLHPGVGDPEVGLLDEHRGEGARGRVGEHLGHAQREDRDQHDRDGHVAGGDRGAEQREDDGAHEVRGHHDRTPVEAVGHGAGVQPDQQPRQSAQQPGHRDQACVVGLRGDEQRPCRHGDPVADVGRPRRDEQPPETPAETCRQDGLDEAAHKRETLRRGSAGCSRFSVT